MRAVITSEVPGVWEHLRQAVLATGVECAGGDCVLFADLAVRLAKAPADLVLVGLGANRPAALAAVAEAVRAGAAALVVARPSDSGAILEAIRCGARGYLDQEHAGADLLATLEKWRGAGVSYRRGRTLGVLSATPGTGVTTVAASLAFALGEKTPGQVVLAELDPGVPVLALNLNLRPAFSVADLAGQWQRMDAAMLRQALVDHPAGVSVLSYRPETLLADALEPAALRQTLVLLSTLFDQVVLDLGHAADDARLEALRLADTVVVVVRLDVPALRLTRQLLRKLDDRGLAPSRLRLVANRYGQRKQVPLAEAARVLGQPILGRIPDDPGTLNLANNQGVPLVHAARRAAITRSFAELAGRLGAA
jgi:Flp pilus assembly CpaE family ATPase